jgi:hypothetical protein
MASQRSGSLVVGKVDTDALPEVAGRFSIRSIPTMILFRGGQQAARLERSDVGGRANHLETSLALTRNERSNDDGRRDPEKPGTEPVEAAGRLA